MSEAIESRLAVCSWSLRPRSPEHLAELIAACGVGGVQLHLDPIRRGEWSMDDTKHALRGLRLVSGMMSMQGEDYSTLDSIKRTGGLLPDATWPANRTAAHLNAKLAADLNIPLVTFHAGFFGDEHDKLVERVREMIVIFARHSVRIALETGQETAPAMSAVCHQTGVGVNFDPANMILYGMGDPVAAVRDLTPYIAQVHIKDALPSPTPGQWGEEKPAGEGAVDWASFLASVPRLTYLASFSGSAPPNLVIERESGDARVEDVRTAAALVRRLAVPHA